MIAHTRADQLLRTKSSASGTASLGRFSGSDLADQELCTRSSASAVVSRGIVALADHEFLTRSSASTSLATNTGLPLPIPSFNETHLHYKMIGIANVPLIMGPARLMPNRTEMMIRRIS